MIKLSELQNKEVIVIDDGKRLGHMHDLEINPDTGKITAIILMVKEAKGGFFGKSDEVIIHWNQIVTIGSDVILVNDVTQPQLYYESNPNYLD